MLKFEKNIYRIFLMGTISYELFYWKNATTMFCRNSCNSRSPLRSLDVSKVFQGADHDYGDNLGR